MTHPATEERNEQKQETGERENPAPKEQSAGNNGETIRLIAVFVLGVSVGICLTLIYLEFS